MRCLSLKSELSWLIGLVMVVTLAINLCVLVVHAGPRIRAEDETSVHLTRELVVTAIGSLQETSDPLPALNRFYESLGKLRHVDVKVMSSGDTGVPAPGHAGARNQGSVPGWFVDLVHTPARTLIVPVIIKGIDYGRIAIVSNPVDELEEVWSDVSWLALMSLLITSVIMGAVLLLVRQSLKPFEGLKRGLADLEAGKSNVRIEQRGASEFRAISAALNSLAQTLDHVKTENRSLVDRLIRVQDDERKEIARDLHDEAGPCLFSIRAGVVALIELSADANLDAEKIQKTCNSVNQASEVLQNLFRALLGRLAPRELTEFGLREGLMGLIKSWQVSRSDVTLSLACPHDLSILDEPTALTAFRVVQESLTNVFRHAHAAAARVRVEFGSMPAVSPDHAVFERNRSNADNVIDSKLERDSREKPTSTFSHRALPDQEAEDTPALLIEIEDDGVGISEHPKLSLGLLGMRERVQALEGTISIGKRPEGGTCVAAALPLPKDNEVDP
ncbi:histidine kinase [Methylocystis bryophila]|uniref:ATP-binding protein n=1 Tax=Methylocystis bryophila TaxID=655015 RepID=A0A1W6N0P8_9HYPH|nr:histidine kinase [Methylocystis bryophila]ARN83393.1 ATP-binding protein [Methylocystis bryophila]BDV40539.1 sensor histidine kinase [Methylocystis bryophila]